MNRSIAVPLGLVLVVALHAGSAASKPAAVTKSAARPSTARDGWPTTRAGDMGRRWVEAFASGEPAMRAFLASELTEESLAKKSMSERMATYRDTREKLGQLTFASIVKSSPNELKAKLMDSDGATHEFTFQVQGAPPFKLIAVSRMARGHGFGFRHGS